MSPLDTGFPRDPGTKKRMLPSVTDVVRELAKTVSADPAVLFKAARSVVAEELAKVKQGFEAAPLDVLVRRARLQLERDGAGSPVGETAPPPMPVFPARPATSREGPGSTSPPAKPLAADEPFQDLASRSDLNWEKDLPIQPEDAPFRSAILPIPRKSRGPLEISAPAPAPLAYVPQPPSAPPEPETAEPAPAPGAPLPGAPVPLAYVPASMPPAQSEPSPPRETRPGLTGDLFGELQTEVPVAPKPLPRPAIASAPSIPLVQMREPQPSGMHDDPLPASTREGFERYLKAPSTPAPPPVAREPQEPREPYAPRVRSTPEMPPLQELLEDNTQPAMEEFHFKAADTLPPPPPRSARRGWLVAIAFVLAIGAGLAWAVREYVFKNEIVKSVPPIARKTPEPAPAVTSVPVAAPTPALAAKPTAQPPKAAPPVARGKAAVLLTPDWAGKAVVYVIHFSSTKDRESAAKEAVKLGAALGAPARAVEVNLGDKGVWYRVVVGEFPDVDAARAFRAELEAKKTPGMGFVYEMRGR